ncbi:hypothetical protein BaRGS_00015129 [Batillaria attramentaria]|uniref:Uncharacterized protein n=1 Tax=Batillaria attramentaria TaxID=370345 RepID=A0ABD0L3K4_9CAEN
MSYFMIVIPKLITLISQVVSRVGTNRPALSHVERTVTGDVKEILEFVTIVFRVGTNRPVLNHVEKTVTADVTGILVFVTVAEQGFMGNSVKLRVGTDVSTKHATDRMALVPVNFCGIRLVAQNARTVITEESGVDLVVTVVTIPSVIIMTDTVLMDVMTVIAVICVTVMEVSPENALRDTEGDKTETTDPDGNYSRLENYENPDDIRPYSMLQTDRGHNTNINIQGDKEAVLYHNQY